MLSVDIAKKLGSFALNASFEADAGVTGILGASGSGKSMTLRCIAGIEKPDRGKIALDGITLFDSEKKINLTPQKRQVGYLFQNYALFPSMTVKKNILCGMYHEKDKEVRQKALEEAISLLQLDGLENHRPSQLSGGQAQRVALARILVNKPRLLMLDEPFSALDSHLRGQLQIQMKKILEQYGGAVLLVTHSRNEAYHLCQQIALMEAGSISPPSPTKALFSDPLTISGAIMTGCKNISSAVKTSDHEVEVPDWGVRLQTAQTVKDDVCAVGIRAHYFGAKATKNRFPVFMTDEMEEPFEWIIRFRFQNQKKNSPDVWWRLSKDRRLQQMPDMLGVSPSNVMLLYPRPEKATECLAFDPN
ncbi:MAG: ATP-binding cassette domain-containing protein [Clostridiales bacterium]|jgi:molybdate transport system ATP-binding protein|nr:ATP-binding cassette domain-containing protein [Clostridiales bacterium]